MTFLINEIQVLQHRWKKCVDNKEGYAKKKPHLVAFHENIFVSQLTFQQTHVHNSQKV